MDDDAASQGSEQMPSGISMQSSFSAMSTESGDGDSVGLGGDALPPAFPQLGAHMSSVSTADEERIKEGMANVHRRTVSVNNDEVVREGFLAKKTTRRGHDHAMVTGNKRFNERYFVLTRTQLKYYDKKPEVEDDNLPSVSMPLINISLVVPYNYDVGDDTGKRFMVRGQRRRVRGVSAASPVASRGHAVLEEVDMNLRAESPEDATAWMVVIGEQLEIVRQNSMQLCDVAWSTMAAYLQQNSAVQQHYRRFEEEEGLRDGLRAELPESLLCRSAPRIPAPGMSILILVVGTRGDVAPFIALGLQLKAAGNRIRIGTHDVYRGDVVGAGLEYYPLGGDPKKLSSFMVKTEGRLIPNLMNKEERTELPEKTAMLDDIIKTVWPAATAVDPEAPEKGRFIADAIISNPVSYAHIHAAEALGVPLHLMFPQPWTPTKAFPHPFANLPYTRGWSRQNWASYYAVDEFFWTGVKPYINDARVRLMGMDPIRTGELGAFMTLDNYVPWTFMWSPALAPKPKDWGEHVDVAGNFFTDVDSAVKDYTPPPAAAAWLDAGDAPIFVGFGSMVIADTAKLTALILDAAAAAGVRVLIQSSWSELTADNLPDNVFLMGNCPHDWLFPRMGAVVHHGGAGTTAAGLKYGKPTMICPFFGDQHFWGQMVYDRGCGPKPVPIVSMTAEVLAESFKELTSPSCREKAGEMAAAFAKEDGVKAGVESFYKNLPLENMVCQVSLFTDTPRLAHVRCPACNLLMSLEAARAIHVGPLSTHKMEVHRFADLGPRGPDNIVEGVKEGGYTLVHEVVGGVVGLALDPIRGQKEDGLKGLAKGVGTGLVNVVRRPVRGLVLSIDKAVTGGYNNYMLWKQKESKEAFMQKKRFLLSDFNRFSTWNEELHDMVATSFFSEDMKDRPVKAGNVLKHRASMLEKLPDAETTLLREAHTRARAARMRFSERSGGNDFINRSDVSKIVETAAKEMGVDPAMIDAVLGALEADQGVISFPLFCAFVAMVEGRSVVANDAEAAAAATSVDSAADGGAGAATGAASGAVAATAPADLAIHFERATVTAAAAVTEETKEETASTQPPTPQQQPAKGKPPSDASPVPAPHATALSEECSGEPPAPPPPRGLTRGRSELADLLHGCGKSADTAQRQRVVQDILAAMWKKGTPAPSPATSFELSQSDEKPPAVVEAAA